MAYKQKGSINFGEGTGSNSSPNKLKWTIALEGYYKAYEAHQEKKRNKEEAKKTSEMIERVSSKDYVAPSDASSNMVQVWDENLGRKRWVHNPKAYKEQQNKKKKKEENVETKKSTTSKIPAVGTDARKKYYDKKNWKYDDTIKGYNRDGTKK
tara:strand:- start:1132 stop:1590 length:459 start_codon:yes stop_codon:yes gene_type:complete